MAVGEFTSFFADANENCLWFTDEGISEKTIKSIYPQVIFCVLVFFNETRVFNTSVSRAWLGFATRVSMFDGFVFNFVRYGKVGAHGHNLIRACHLQMVTLGELL